MAGDGTGASWKCYAHVSRAPTWRAATTSSTVLLPYNQSKRPRRVERDVAPGRLGAPHRHVAADKTTLNSVYYAAHESEGTRQPLSALQANGLLVNGTHPKSYVARGVHANYSYAGVKDRSVAGVDYSTARGSSRLARWPVAWSTSATTGGFAVPFFRYAGRWGAYTGVDVTSGPFSPGSRPTTGRPAPGPDPARAAAAPAAA